MQRIAVAATLSVLLAGAAAVAANASSQRSSMLDVSAFGRLPVVMSGGIHPVDTAARLSLMRISGSDRVVTDTGSRLAFWRGSRALGPTEWFLEVLTKPEADGRRIFPVADATVRGKLGLGTAPGGLYTFAELQPKVNDIAREAGRIEKVDAAARAVWEREWLALRARLGVYARLRTTLQPNAIAATGAKYDFAPRLAKYQQDLKVLATASKDRGRGKAQPIDPQQQNAIKGFAAPFASIARSGFVAMIPPSEASRESAGWQTVAAAITESTRDGRLRPGVVAMAQMTSAYAAGNADAFDREVAKYGQWLRTRGFAREVERSRYEYFYTRAQPFAGAAVFYIAAGLCMGAWVFTRRVMLRRGGQVLMVLGLSLHAAGMLWLGLIAGGVPPVNTYTSAIAAGLVAATAATFAVRQRGFRRVAAVHAR